MATVPGPDDLPNASAQPTKIAPDASMLDNTAGAADKPITPKGELVVLTGLSGAGKLSALKSFEDLGYYAVDNLPLELVPQFAELVRSSNDITRAVLGVDAREGSIERFPKILQEVRNKLSVRVVFLEAADDVLVRRYSETRRPHPLRRDELVSASIADERRRMDPIRNLADVILDTSKFNVHELRAHINAQFNRKEGEQPLLVSTMSFGFKNGVPPEADLVFDVRFLPNPHFIPEFRPLTGRDPQVAQYVM
ncbi:MAG: RNase adapter RapZ, partial [Janthinobacterium lividum]